MAFTVVLPPAHVRFSFIFAHGIWAEDCNLSPALSVLRQQLQQSTLSSRAPNTVLSYARAFRHFLQFAKTHNFVALPATSMNIALFLQYRLNEATSAAPVCQTLYGINWAHNLCGFPSVSSEPLCQAVLETARRKFALSAGAKVAATPELLHAMAMECSQSSDLMPWRTFVVSLLMFAGCLRWSEVSVLTAHDIEFSDNSVLLIIRKSKTDQHKVGNQVFLAACASALCPRAALLRYCALANITVPSVQSLFCNVSGRKLNSKLLSYSNQLALVRAVASRHRLCQPSSLGLHSFRSGGATLLVNNGADSAAIREFGRWHHPSSMDRYLRRSRETKLATSALMQL